MEKRDNASRHPKGRVMQKKNLIALLCFSAVIAVGASAAIWAKAPAAATKAASAEVKAGLGIEKYEITGEADHFKVAPDTKIYAWTKVSGLENSKITFAFTKGEKVVFQQELPVARNSHRTNAYRTFRQGDDGEWVVKVLDPGGAVLGSVTFKVEITK
jgi:hypothetical protein